MNLAFDIRNEILGNETHVFNAIQSNYNPNVFLEKCQDCGYKPIHSTDIPLETHHINFQCNADQDGNFKEFGFHKNVEHNLVVLCRDCHQKVHQGYKEIKGYIATGDGPILEVFDHESPISLEKKVARKKFTDDQVQQIKSFVDKNTNLKKKDILYQLSTQNELNLDYKLLSKIINNQY